MPFTRLGERTLKRHTRPLGYLYEQGRRAAGTLHARAPARFSVTDLRVALASRLVGSRDCGLLLDLLAIIRKRRTDTEAVLTPDERAEHISREL